MTVNELLERLQAEVDAERGEWPVFMVSVGTHIAVVEARRLEPANAVLLEGPS